MSDFFKTVAGKTILFFSTVILICLLIASSVASVFLTIYGFYTNSEHRVYNDLASESLRNNGRDAIREIISTYGVSHTTDWNHDTNLMLEISKMDTNEVLYRTDTVPLEWDFDCVYGVWRENKTTISYIAYLENGESVFESMDRNFFSPDHRGDGEAEYYRLRASVRPDLPIDDWYSFLNKAVQTGYVMRVWVLILDPILLLLSASSYIALMSVSGCRPKSKEIIPGPLYKVPFDLMLLITVGGGIAVFFINLYTWYINFSWSIVSAVLTILLGVTALVALSMGAAARIKLKTFFNNNIITYILIGLGKFFKAFGRLMARFFTSIPSFWRVFLIFLAFIILKMMVVGLAFTLESFVVLFVGWLFIDILVGFIILLIVYFMKELSTAGEQLASGNLDYKTNTEFMPYLFRKHGENLNSLGEVTAKSIEDKLRSERSKTDLITNVSHDIKTPLTSIINYATLIGTEGSKDPVIADYSAVLVRQSAKLKRLIEDLIEVSKAQSGSLEMNLDACDACVLIEQMGGEFEERLADMGLTFVSTIPDHPVEILADGRHMWRVFDNLMNNICKYALRGTRVFLTLTVDDEHAYISFKNTSSTSLNIKAEDLLERFVRADGSRNSEGSGLGIPIAKSMTELQGGKFDLTIDGDFFKVTLVFPLYHEEVNEGESKTPSEEQ